MKITHNKIGQNLNLRESSKDNATKDIKGGKDVEDVGSTSASKIDRTKEKSMDNVNLSSRAQDIKKIRERLDSVPDVDEAKVARFQQLIDSGNYKVSAADIADKMVDEQLKTQG